MFWGIDNIPQNIPDISCIQTKCGKSPEIFREILSVPPKTVIDLNDVMYFYFILFFNFVKNLQKLCQKYTRRPYSECLG